MKRSRDARARVKAERRHPRSARDNGDRSERTRDLRAQARQAYAKKYYKEAVDLYLVAMDSALDDGDLGDAASSRMLAKYALVHWIAKKERWTNPDITNTPLASPGHDAPGFRSEGGTIHVYDVDTDKGLHLVEIDDRMRHKITKIHNVRSKRL
jgi:hypothetical protein